MNHPLIGVTTSELRIAEQVTPVPEGDPPRPEMALGLSYLKAIERGGGIPVVIPPVAPDAIAPLISRLSGLCLSGGPDIHPTAYGGEPHEALGPTWTELDVAEIALAREADKRRLPILAICRGAQALNVARRGTLFQHLPENYGRGVEHRMPGYGPGVAHSVEIDPLSRLAEALGTTSLEVNSFHHQAADELGRDLRAVAYSPDGVIEGIEASNREFTIGVQWHAEAMTEESWHRRLFRIFVEAAERYEAAPERAMAAIA
ncbi:MAG: gamma-glutamyl-gamma-aminobutyrate hydrolase family protein [Actinomycetota bacterium]|nr:gamma-glutamyl-gamma-aminobutyrate hydrolase family protein [Actinomycetota bacterium]